MVNRFTVTLLRLRLLDHKLTDADRVMVALDKAGFARGARPAAADASDSTSLS